MNLTTYNNFDIRITRWSCEWRRVDDNKSFASSGLSSLSYHNKVVFSLYRLQHITRTLYHCSIIGEKLGYGMG